MNIPPQLVFPGLTGQPQAYPKGGRQFIPIFISSLGSLQKKFYYSGQ